jgi:hypothetical protein
MNILAQILPVAGPWAVFAAICLWLMRSGFRDKEKFVIRDRQRQAAEAEKTREMEEALKRAATAQMELQYPAYSAPYGQAVGQRR